MSYDSGLYFENALVVALSGTLFGPKCMAQCYGRVAL